MRTAALPDRHTEIRQGDAEIDDAKYDEMIAWFDEVQTWIGETKTGIEDMLNTEG